MADRTVTTRLKLAVNDWTSGANTVKRDLRDLNRQFSETAGFASGFRKKLEDATKAIPKIEIDANSSPAEVKIAEIRARLEELSRKEIGVDFDGAQAMAEMRELQRELEALDDKDVAFEVRAGVAQAMSELRAIDGEINRVDGRAARVKVDADVGSALAGIAMVGAAVASLPAVTTIAVGVTALGSAFAAAGLGAAAFSAVAVPSMGRINEALKAQEAAASAAGSATGGAGKSAAQAAQQAMQLEQAERRLKEAQQERRQAQEDLTRAVESGRRALEDMNFSLERSILSNKDAALAVREAEARLAELQSKGDASDLEIERAMLSVEMAHQRAREQEVKTQRAKKDTAEANREGIKGTQEYQRAQEKLTQAETKVTEATAALKQMQLQQQAAMSGGGGAAGKLKDAFAGLSEEEKKLAKEIKSFTDDYVAWQRSIQPDVFPAISEGLGVMRAGLDLIEPGARGAGRALTGLGKEAKQALRDDPFWKDFFNDINKEIPGAITSLGHIGGNVFKGFAGVIQALLPYGKDLLGNVEDISEKFSTWGTGLGEDSNFRRFMFEVQTNGPAIWETLKNVAETGGDLVEALAPFGVGALSGLSLLAKLTAGMDPGHIQGIALAVGAIYLAVKSGQAINGAVDALGRLRDRVNDVGNAAGSGKSGVGGKLSGMIGMLGAGGPWGLAIGGAALAVGAFAQKHAEAEGRIRDMAAALKESRGAISDEIKAMAERNLIDSGAAKAAYDLGINLGTLQKAALGNKSALAEVNAAITRYTDVTKGANVTGGSWSGTVDSNVRAANLLKDALNGSNSELVESQKEAALSTAMTTNLGKSFNEAKKAIDDAGGSMDTTTAKTASQRDAAGLARDKFNEFRKAVEDSANAQATLSGKAEDATRVVREQLDPLFRLAGNNKTAREEVYKLAEGFGINRTEADKAAAGVKGVSDKITDLKGKKVDVGADTKQAHDALNALKIAILKMTAANVVVTLSTIQKKEAGGIVAYEQGGIEAYASGGLTTGPRPGPHIATRPTVLFGEGKDREAYIPYDVSHRARAIGLLGQVADDFGLAVYNKAASEQVSALQGGLREANFGISNGLTQATSTLDATLGAGGSFTSTLVSVSATGQELTAGWVTGSAALGDSVSGMSETISTSLGDLGSTVQDLAAVIGEAASWTSSAEAKQSATRGTIPRAGGTANASLERSTRKLKAPAGYVGDAAGPTDAEIRRRMAAQGAVVPGGSLREAYSSAPVNSSKVSRPQQMSYQPTSSSPVGVGSAGAVSGSGGGQQISKSVHFHDTVVRETADANVLFAQASMYLGGRG